MRSEPASPGSSLETQILGLRLRPTDQSLWVRPGVCDGACSGVSYSLKLEKFWCREQSCLSHILHGREQGTLMGQDGGRSTRSPWRRHCVVGHLDTEGKGRPWGHGSNGSSSLRSLDPTESTKVMTIRNVPLPWKTRAFRLVSKKRGCIKVI